jgi:hypothetical protein
MDFVYQTCQKLHVCQRTALFHLKAKIEHNLTCKHICGGGRGTKHITHTKQKWEEMLDGSEEQTGFTHRHQQTELNQDISSLLGNSFNYSLQSKKANIYGNYYGRAVEYCGRTVLDMHFRHLWRQQSR